MKESITFTPAPDGLLAQLSLSAVEVQLWSAFVDLPAERVREFERGLSADERERAQRFVFERDRNRSIVSRGFLRALLSRYTGHSAQSIPIENGNKGKPHWRCGGIHFNVSHSEKLIVIGFTRVGPLGVDIEHLRVLLDAESIAERFFSPAEARNFTETPLRLRAQAFFNCWTRKEAYVKAVGDGLHIPLDSFEVTFRPGENPTLSCLGGDSERATGWSVYHLEPSPGYVGALVMNSGRLPVQAWSLDLSRESY